MFHYVNTTTRAFVTVDYPLNKPTWMTPQEYHWAYVGADDLTLQEILRCYDVDSLDELALRVWVEVAQSEDPSYLRFVQRMREFVPSFRLRAARAMRSRLDRALYKRGQQLPHMKAPSPSAPNAERLAHILNKKENKHA